MSMNGQCAIFSNIKSRYIGDKGEIKDPLIRDVFDVMDSIYFGDFGEKIRELDRDIAKALEDWAIYGGVKHQENIAEVALEQKHFFEKIIRTCAKEPLDVAKEKMTNYCKNVLYPELRNECDIAMEKMAILKEKNGLEFKGLLTERYVAEELTAFCSPHPQNELQLKERSKKSKVFAFLKNIWDNIIRNETRRQ